MTFGEFKQLGYDSDLPMEYALVQSLFEGKITIATNLDMKTEEKAKRYDEALEWMRKVYPTLTGADKEDTEHYFPELAESEDERIRKVLVDMVKKETGFTGFPSQGQILSYLEKQKEQKPVGWKPQPESKKYC